MDNLEKLHSELVTAAAGMVEDAKTAQVELRIQKLKTLAEIYVMLNEHEPLGEADSEDEYSEDE